MNWNSAIETDKRAFKLTSVIVAVCIVGCVCGICGCSESDTAKKKANSTQTSVTDHGDYCYTKVIEGHKYIIFQGYKCGGIIHAESCSCKSNCQQ